MAGTVGARLLAQLVALIVVKAPPGVGDRSLRKVAETKTRFLAKEKK